MFEVEFRSRFNYRKFKKVKNYLDKHAEKLGQDDKDCYFYIFPDKLLKIVNNISKKNAKISLKLNRLGKGVLFPEIEFYFPQEQFKNSIKLFNALSLPAKVIREKQKRINYKYKNCEIALKHSKSWGYHLEIEKIIDKKEKKQKAKSDIRKIAQEIGVKLMSEKEIKTFIKKFESKL